MEAARVEGEADRDGSGERMREAMDGGELHRREVAAAIWKGGGGGCDLEGMSAAVGEKGMRGVVGDWGWGRGWRTAAAGWLGIQRLRRRVGGGSCGMRGRDWIGGEEGMSVRVWVRG